MEQLIAFAVFIGVVTLLLERFYGLIVATKHLFTVFKRKKDRRRTRRKVR